MSRRALFVSNLAIALVLAGCGGEPPDTREQAGAAASPPPAAASTEQTASKAEVIATGANIAGSNGLHVGPDGNLYVASVIGSDISVIDPDSGEILERHTAADGVIGPDDVAFSADGAFYWTSILTGEVAGFLPNGERVVAATLEPGVNPITFSDDGRLFVSQCFLGDKLYEIDPMGEEEPRLIAGDLGPGCGLNGMDWGPDDRLYGPRWFVGEVVSFDVDSGTRRTEAEGFTTPAAVKFSPDGKLHVLDTATGEVVRVDNGETTVVATLDPGLDNFAFDDAGNLYVTSFADGSVTRITTDGEKTALQPGGMAHPGGIVIVDGEAIVADLHAIRGFAVPSGDSTFVQRNIVGTGEMGGAINIAADGPNLILTSWFDGDVRVWDRAGERRLEHYTDVVAPVAAVRYAGKIAVADHGTGSVVLLGEGGEKTTVAADLPAPTGLVVDQQDLYVSDREQGRILMIARDGKPMEEPLVVADNLTTPEGFVMTRDGFVVVEADAGQVVAVNTAGEKQVLAEIEPGSQAAPGTPPSQVFNGIARGPDGAYYVTGETRRVLYRIPGPNG